MEAGGQPSASPAIERIAGRSGGDGPPLSEIQTLSFAWRSN